MKHLLAENTVHFNVRNFTWLDQICQDPKWEGVDASLREAYAAALAQMREEECRCLLECNGFPDLSSPYCSWDGDNLVLWDDDEPLLTIIGAKTHASSTLSR